MNSKFLAAATAALVCASSAFVADYESEGSQGYDVESRRTTPVQVGIADPLMLPGMGYDVCGLRWSFFYGSSYNVTGLDLSLVGLARESLKGVALNGFGWVEGEVAGLQLGLVANIDGLDVYGVSFAVGANSCRSGFYGVQAALINCSGNLAGVQAGLVNWNSSFSSGLQLGLINVDAGEFSGASFGLVNCTESFAGFQMGLLNVATKTGRGVQLGLFNAADRHTGAQIGLLNLIGNATIPVLPFVNANF